MAKAKEADKKKKGEKKPGNPFAKEQDMTFKKKKKPGKK
jgi:hypothetical protein